MAEQINRPRPQPRVFVERALSPVSVAQPTRRSDQLHYETSGAITGAQPVIAPLGQLREGYEWAGAAGASVPC